MDQTVCTRVTVRMVQGVTQSRGAVTARQDGTDNTVTLVSV